jgi:hypothetical protein
MRGQSQAFPSLLLVNYLSLHTFQFVIYEMPFVSNLTIYQVILTSKLAAIEAYCHLLKRYMDQQPNRNCYNEMRQTRKS